MGSSVHRNARDGKIRRIMQRLGIEPGGATPSRWELAYMTAVRECPKCQAGESCLRELERGSVARCLAPASCPNAGLLFELMFEGLPPHAERPQ